MRGSIRTRKDDRCLDVFFHIRVDEAKWYPVNFGGVVTVLCDTKNLKWWLFDDPRKHDSNKRDADEGDKERQGRSSGALK